MNAGTQTKHDASEEQTVLRQELEQAFHNGELIVICWEPDCTMHRLPYWDESKWIARQEEPAYPYYSHGICRWHFRAYWHEIDRYAEQEANGRGSMSAIATT